MKTGEHQVSKANKVNKIVLRSFYLFIGLILIISFINSVAAITGSIGNARMILRVDQGDEIRKYILVKNVNDVPVNIDIFASGDLADDISFEENKFSLEPGEDKKAYFKIKVKKAGTTETKINVQFAPTDEGNGVGLSSTVIVIAEKSNWFDNLFGDDNEDEDSKDESSEDEKEVSVSVSGVTGNVVSEEGSKMNKSLLVGAFSMTLILCIIFIVLLIVSSSIGENKKFKENKREDKKSDEIKSKKSVRKK